MVSLTLAATSTSLSASSAVSAASCVVADFPALNLMIPYSDEREVPAGARAPRAGDLVADFPALIIEEPHDIIIAEPHDIIIAEPHDIIIAEFPVLNIMIPYNEAREIPAGAPRAGDLFAIADFPVVELVPPPIQLVIVEEDDVRPSGAMAPRPCALCQTECDFCAVADFPVAHHLPPIQLVIVEEDDVRPSGAMAPLASIMRQAEDPWAEVPNGVPYAEPKKDNN
jgi:hypothetical protein